MVILSPPVPPAQPPRKALGKGWGTLVQVRASRSDPAVINLQGGGGQSPMRAFSLAQRRCYNDGEVAVGPGLCVHARAAAGSDYAATMFCSINIMSSLNLY